jgi:hypothetical protein
MASLVAQNVNQKSAAKSEEENNGLFIWNFSRRGSILGVGQIRSTKSRRLMEVSPVHYTVPTTYTHRDIVYQVFDGIVPGTKKVLAHIYDVTVYDRSGHLKTSTAVHTVEYTA